MPGYAFRQMLGVPCSFPPKLTRDSGSGWSTLGYVTQSTAHGTSHWEEGYFSPEMPCHTEKTLKFPHHGVAPCSLQSSAHLRTELSDTVVMSLYLGRLVGRRFLTEEGGLPIRN